LTAASIHVLDPIADRRWADLVDRHPHASVFHSPAYLAALQQTYGYQVIAVTLSNLQEKLTNGMVFARVASRITGNRLVSLPFADHCEPLTEDVAQTQQLAAAAREAQKDNGYVELRPRILPEGTLAGFGASARYCLHTLDLTADLKEIYGRFHPSCIQRRIKRAERMNLRYEESREESAVAGFYRLQVLTRARHGLPPQPLKWFQNLRNNFGDQFLVHTISSNEQPLASMITLRQGNTLTYKYGASDAKQHRLGGMVLLFWQAIQNAKARGITQMDLGRSDLTSTGLIDFKNHWGATLSTLVYLRSPEPCSEEESNSRHLNLARKVFAHTPARLAELAGAVLYKHVG
jgi:CelD/BcsL family acetyltransferase involved in cellulose biosynthesis